MGTRADGDPETGNSIYPLCPPGKYIATRPYDMLSIQEWHMSQAWPLCPPCPIPKLVLDELCRIPEGTPPLISRPIDLETFERSARRQPNDRAPGSDGQPREYVKYGPAALLELYWKADNAYLAGETPSVCAHEWSGAVAGYIPKEAISLTDDLIPTDRVYMYEVFSSPLDCS